MIASVLTIAKGGSGIVRTEDKTVFLPGVITGETVEFTIAGRLRSAWQGKLLRVLEPSPQRVEPRCPHYPECGGCNLQHMSYGEQLRCKTEILLGNLKMIAGVVPGAVPAAMASPPWRYRSKGEFQIRAGVAGFFARESHRLVAINGCLLLPEALESFFLAQRPRAGGMEKGQMQILSNGCDIAARLEAADGGETWLSDERAVRFTVGSYAYRFAPDNFIQANLFQLLPMLGLLERALEREAPATAVDLFCGGGFLTLPLAARCRDVLAMESDPGNITALRANLELNRATNVRIAAADVLHSDLPAADLFVVDPPRGGLSSRLIAALAGSGAGTIIYFSCDSATFARDLRLFLSRGFKLDELKLIDNFPQSDHFEIFSVLKKRRSQ
ncbi:MAG: methyltransferase [Acidobacteriota bacterium]|jgi:23S rRNA (uracil1939-C5)-methyltransferase|nr:methyltransferase [Acidobacteriota bacterium]